MRDDDAKVRALMRSKNIDTRANCGYNPLNGSDRRSVDVPQHRMYNPDPLQSVGSVILGNGYAGRPLRPDLFQPPKSTQSQTYPSQPQLTNMNPMAQQSSMQQQ